jgi:hypothetical protein
MNRTTTILLIVVVALLLCGGLLFIFIPKPVAMHLQLTGTPGAKVTGSYTLDGVTNPIEGALPIDIKVTGNSMDYSVELIEDGELNGMLKVAGNQMGSSSAQGPHNGVQGNYTREPLSMSAAFSTFTKDSK